MTHPVLTTSFASMCVRVTVDDSMIFDMKRANLAKILCCSVEKDCHVMAFQVIIRGRCEEDLYAY